MPTGTSHYEEALIREYYQAFTAADGSARY
jgi:hypothetical protein